MIKRWWAAPVAAAAVGLLAACGSTASPASSSSGSGGGTAGTTSSSASGIKTASTSKGTVLVDSKGHTLYWFAIDTMSTSKCNSGCTSIWPPVLGKPSMASGASMSGKLGTIKRANGQVQATYMGHPLYTYTADTSAGQVHGNGVNSSGGLWWAMTPSGAKLSKAKGGGGSGGGGYGY
jgi:predicted lipoprotein with Yx(FWY)xxD motif